MVMGLGSCVKGLLFFNALQCGQQYIPSRIKRVWNLYSRELFLLQSRYVSEVNGICISRKQIVKEHFVEMITLIWLQLVLEMIELFNF